MLISVLLPVYNVASFVEEALLSICNQSYKNLEIIVIDDCSTDNTFEIVKNLATTDSRIKLYRNQENIKLVATLNKGLNYVTGEYIVRMDGDDISMPDRIERMFSYLNNHPTCSLVSTQVITIDENGSELGFSNLPTNETLIKQVCPYISPILHIWMCKTSLYKELHGYRDILGAEDYDFILRAISAGYNIANLSEYLYKVRIRQGNTVSTIGVKQEISHAYCVKLYKERTKKNTNSDSYNITYLLSEFDKASSDQKDFTNCYIEFQKGFKLIKNRHFFGIYYIITSLTKSKYIRHYIKNRIIYRLIIWSNKI